MQHCNETYWIAVVVEVLVEVVVVVVVVVVVKAYKRAFLRPSLTRPNAMQSSVCHGQIGGSELINLPGYSYSVSKLSS